MMIVALVASVPAFAQTSAPATNAAPTPSWRSSLSALPATPPANTSAQDIVQFERNMRMAASYLGTVNAGSANGTDTQTAQWEANRDMVRRMATYLYGLKVLSSDPKMRGAVNSAQRSFNSLGFAPYLAYPLASQGYPDVNQNSQPAPQQQMRQALPPFSMNAPDLAGVSDADKDAAAELHGRYEADAARSAGVWGNAETLRQSLEMRGLGLNVEAATAMVRLPQQFRSAEADLRINDWDSARTHLEQAEAITEKLAKTVGR